MLMLLFSYVVDSEYFDMRWWCSECWAEDIIVFCLIDKVQCQEYSLHLYTSNIFQYPPECVSQSLFTHQRWYRMHQVKSKLYLTGYLLASLKKLINWGPRLRFIFYVQMFTYFNHALNDCHNQKLSYLLLCIFLVHP